MPLGAAPAIRVVDAVAEIFFGVNKEFFSELSSFRMNGAPERTGAIEKGRLPARGASDQEIKSKSDRPWIRLYDCCAACIAVSWKFKRVTASA